MKSHCFCSVLLAVFLSTNALAQVDKIVIPAGTPEDQALTQIANEQDASKKVSMYEDFMQKFSTNPVALAYGNWQLAQYYQSSGDLQKAAEYGAKAASGSPHNMDILVTQVTIAQGLKDNAAMLKYSLQGGDAYDSIEKQAKPADLSDQEFASRIASDKDANKSSYDFFESAAYSAIASENDPKTRMDDIDKFNTTFSNSKFADQVGSLAMLALSQLNDKRRLVEYADKALASNPNSLPALLLLANSYADGNDPASLQKAITNAQKAIVVAKADDPSADKSSKISAGVAHSTLGRVYAKQAKTAASIAELKSATSLLKGQDEQQFAVAAYFLGWDYAKISRLTEARAVLTDAAGIPGPMQPSIKELLTKVNSARAAGK
jgi:tetratricopeptide (TPR) repeat protein